MSALAPCEPVLAPCNAGALFVPAVNDPDGVRFMQVKAGLTVAEMLGPNAAHSLRVTIGGIELPRRLFATVRPKAGKTITVEFWPQGGGSARKWILTIVAIVATVFSYGAASGASWALVGGYSASTSALIFAGVGALAIAFIPPPSLGGLGDGGGALEQLASLTGTQNQTNPYGAIPLVMGNWRFHPPHAALPFTEISGDDQYLRMLLDIGLGDLDVSDITIGETPIGNYEDVDWEMSTTPSLFTQDIYELQVGAALVGENDTVQRTTQANSTEISLDLVFAQGLYGVDAKGKTVTGLTYFHIQYRAVGDTGAWSNAVSAPGLTVTGGLKAMSVDFSMVSTRRKMLRLGVRWTVPAGQYDVVVVRGTTSWTGAMDNAKIGDATWTVLRSVSPQVPSTTGTTKLAIRIKATDQLHGVVSTLAVTAAQKIRRWDATNQVWLAPAASTNPAWIYLWMLLDCPGAVRHATEAQVDLDGIAAWAADCDTQGYIYSGIADATQRFSDVAKNVLACGRATAGIHNGKYSVVRDIAQTVPMQVYSPINGTSLTYERSFAEPPQALRVSFTNPAANGQQDERLVYWDGFDAANTTRISPLDLRNVTDPGTAWKLARYHLAVLWLRPNKYHLDVDIEHLISERGDLVEIAAPIIGWGVAYGRIRAISGSAITLSEPFTVETGKTYAVRVRLGTAYSQVSNVTVAAADIVNSKAKTVTLVTAIPGIALDQIAVIGEVDKLTKPVLISAIEPGSNMLTRSATLTCVDAAPGVWTAADGTPPVFVSTITGTSWCSAPNPPVVHIYASDSVPDDAGVVHVHASLANQGDNSGIYRFGHSLSGVSCVVVESWLPGKRQAADVKVGATLAMADPATLAPARAKVTYSAPVRQPCVEIITASGITLRCSLSAPIPTEHNGLTHAPDLAGKSVAVRDADGVRWEPVARIRGIGEHMVQHITVADGCFWAGAVDGRFILHHNKRMTAPGDGPRFGNNVLVAAR